MTIPDSILTRLRKIHALAEQGVDGERDAARLQLDKLLEQYELTIEELTDQKPIEHWITYKGRDARKLFIQICGQVLDMPRPPCAFTNKRLFVTCTAAQWIDIDERFLHYLLEADKAKAALAKQRRLVVSALIQKHGIFPEHPGESADRELTEKEKRESRDLFDAMSRLRTTGFTKPAPRLEHSQ